MIGATGRGRRRQRGGIFQGPAGNAALPLSFAPRKRDGSRPVHRSEIHPQPFESSILPRISSSVASSGAVAVMVMKESPAFRQTSSSCIRAP